MAKKKKRAAKKKIKGGRLRRNLTSLALFVLILYAGTHIISRTDGARAAIAEQISDGTGLPVALKKCGATPLLGLRLQGLSFEGVEMPEVKATINWRALFSEEAPLIKKLEVRRMEVQLKRIPASGNWEPLVLNGIGRRLGAVLGLHSARLDETATLPQFPGRAINHQTQLELENAKIVWRNELGREMAYITDVDLNVRANSLIQRKAIQTILNCGHIKLASGRTLRDFQMETFRVEGSDWTTVLGMSDSNGEYDEFATQNLWPDLCLRLRQLSTMR